MFPGSMIRSMSGFGAASRELDGASLSVEIRSVNSRHLNLRFRVPGGAESWEPKLREWLSEEFRRGSVDVSVRLEISGEAERPPLEMDTRLVEAYLEAFRRLREEYALAGRVDLSHLAGIPGLVRESERRPLEATEAVSEEELEGVVREAAAELIGMREREGGRLAEELRARLRALERGLDVVAEAAPERLERERERLLAAVHELAAESDGDEERLAREIAILADRWDLSEEIVRARSHLEGMEELLGAPGEEPVGKRLSFLIQELQREINTTGAKANDARISREVVEMKNEIESLREQVENIE